MFRYFNSLRAVTARLPPECRARQFTLAATMAWGRYTPDLSHTITLTAENGGRKRAAWLAATALKGSIVTTALSRFARELARQTLGHRLIMSEPDADGGKLD